MAANGAKDYFIKITLACGTVVYDTGGHGWTTRDRRQASGYYARDAQIVLERWRQADGVNASGARGKGVSIASVELEPVLCLN